MTLIQAVVSSVILINRRQTADLFPVSWRNLWREWLLRGLILLSLTAQIVLVILGNRRKYIAKTWIRTIVWFSYLLADSVATMAIGVLSNDLGDVYQTGNCNSHRPEYGLKAFWAPFLLLHLGGMDTITAYSLEDNELWMRHSFGVIAQSMTTVYILFMSWSTSSRLLPLFIVVFFVGLVKYCERVLALFSASEKRFRDSIPEIPTRASKIMEGCKLKHLEGYNVTTHQVLEVEVPVPNNSATNPDNASNNSATNPDNANEILIAHSFLEMVKRLFADLILGFQDRDVSRAIFDSDEMTGDTAAKIIEIELGFMYDLMYTKATVVYSSWGVARRIIGSLLILGVLVMVSLDEALVGQNSSKIDVTITLVLLIVALLLDSCAFAELLLSDQTAHWLIKHKKTTILRAINHIRTLIPTNWGRKRKRWSNSVEQFSLLRFCFATSIKPLVCLRILKMLGIEEVVELYVHKSSTPPIPYSTVKGLFFQQLKATWSWAEQNGYPTDLKSLYGRAGGHSFERVNCSDIEWSVKMEFDQSILVWHLATEICYQLDYGSENPNNWLPVEDPNNQLPLYAGLGKFDLGKGISRYMLYLLVEYPNMLPIGMGQIKFRDLYSDLGVFIEAYMSKPLKDVKEKEASKTLMEEVNAVNMLVGGGDRSKDRSNFVIFHGCKLASMLKKIEKTQKWMVINGVWLEMLGHAASQCKGRQHAQQLRRGGEYLTHIWLLMAHFGLTDHFQIPHSRAIAEAVLR